MRVKDVDSFGNPPRREGRPSKDENSDNVRVSPGGNDPGHLRYRLRDVASLLVHVRLSSWPAGLGARKCRPSEPHPDLWSG